jgi:hypothetical protein
MRKIVAATESADSEGSSNHVQEICRMAESEHNFERRTVSL